MSKKITVDGFNVGGGFEKGDVLSFADEEKKVWDSAGELKFQVYRQTNMEVTGVDPGIVDVAHQEEKYMVKNADTGEETQLNEAVNTQTLYNLLTEFTEGKHPDLTFDDILDLAKL